MYVAGGKGGRLSVTQSARKSYFCVVGKIFKSVMSTLKRKFAVQSLG